MRLNAGRAAFLALLLGAALELRASLSSATVRFGEAPELRMNLPGVPGAGAVLATAVDPNGGEADWIRTVPVVPRDEVVRLTIPIARDDPVGRWVVSMKDLYTNRMVEVPFTVLNGAVE